MFVLAPSKFVLIVLKPPGVQNGSEARQDYRRVFAQTHRHFRQTQKITIGAGLMLWVTVNRGGNTAKVWYLRYYDEAGKQQRSKLGEYPEITLAQAQAQAEDAKKAGKQGVRLAQVQAEKKRVLIDGANEYKEALKNSFEAVAEMWLADKALTWVPGHLKRQRERLQGHLYLALGNKPVSEITMLDVRAALSPLANAGKSETAKRAADLVRNVLEFADTLQMLPDAPSSARSQNTAAKNRRRRKNAIYTTER